VRRVAKFSWKSQLIGGFNLEYGNLKNGDHESVFVSKIGKTGSSMECDGKLEFNLENGYLETAVGKGFEKQISRTSFSTFENTVFDINDFSDHFKNTNTLKILYPRLWLLLQDSLEFSWNLIT